MVSTTYNKKLLELKKQRCLYDSFLKECKDYNQRISIMKEVARLSVLINNIESKPISKTKDVYPEYTIEIPSRMNKSIYQHFEL